MVNYQLGYNSVHHWHTFDKGMLYAKGFFEGKRLDQQVLAQALAACNNKESLIAVLKKINGFFAICVQIEQSTFVVVDHARSYPLFWKADAGQISITDHLSLKNDQELVFWHQQSGFKDTSFIPGHLTLAQAWHQLQAGELIEIKQGICYLHTWFDHHRQLTYEKSDQSFSYWQSAFQALIDQQTQRLIEWANGRRIVIPLSGGYDSRYIVAALLKHQYDNVACFTYGLADRQEISVAQRVAETLAVPWQFFPTSPELLDRFFSPLWNDYTDFACNLTSLPQDQDVLTIAHLKEIGFLQQGDIFCPGYCGDFQAGSNLPDNYFQLPWRRTKALQTYLLDKYLYNLSPELVRFWNNHLPQHKLESEQEVISELEHWALREYISKYIINGVKSYEFHGFEWYLPQWDVDFILFWQKVPNRFRTGMQLYRTTLEDYLFKPMNIFFEEDQLSAKSWSLKSLMNKNLKKKISAYLPYKNTDNGQDFAYLSNQIKKELALENLKEHNEITGMWLDTYLKKINS